MAEDEVEDIDNTKEESSNPFDNKSVDEKIVPVGGLYQIGSWIMPVM